MKQFNFEFQGQLSAKNAQSGQKKINLNRQIKLNSNSISNIMSSSYSASKNSYQFSPNIKLKLDLITSIHPDRKSENSKSPLQPLVSQHQMKQQQYNQYNMDKKKQSLDSLIAIKNHMSPPQFKAKKNIFFGDKMNFNQHEKRSSGYLLQQDNSNYMIPNNIANNPDYNQFRDTELLEENQQPPYLKYLYSNEKTKQNQGQSTAFKKRLSHPQQSLTELHSITYEASPTKLDNQNPFHLPYITVNSKQLENNIQKNKQAIKQMTQEMFASKGGTLKKRPTNKSMQFLEYFESQTLPMSSLVNIKEAEFTSPNSLSHIKKPSSINISNRPSLSETKLLLESSKMQEQNTLLKITEGEEMNSKSKLPSDSQGQLNYWSYKEKSNQNKEKYDKKIRQLNLQESLQKLENKTLKIGISSRLNYAEELKSPNSSGQVDQEKIQISNENNSSSQKQFEIGKLLEISPQKMKEGLARVKRKDEQEEAQILQNQTICESLAQAVMEKIIEQLNLDESDLKSTLTASISSNNNYNLGFALKKYYLFCLQKVMEEHKHLSQQQSVSTLRNNKTRREPKSEDLDSSLQNLILSEQFLEKSKELITQILFNAGIDFNFIKEIHKYFDEYGKFFIPQNNVKRIGMHKIEELLDKLLKSLVDNQLLEKEHLEATQSTTSKSRNYYLEEINHRMIDFAVNLLNEHNESVFVQIQEFKRFQEVQNFEYFMLKIILLHIMREMNLEWSSINIILEKVENIRLIFFRDTKNSNINLYFDQKENHPLIKTRLMKNKLLIETIGENNIDGFIKFLDQFLVGFRDYPNLKKYLNTKQVINKDFIFKFGQELNDIIPEEVVRRETLILDIKHQLTKVLQTVEQTKEKSEEQAQDEMNFFKNIEQINIQDVIYKLVDFVEYKIVTNEIPQDIQEADILVNSKFLDFFLHFTFQNRGLSYSYYDLEVAFSYYKMNSIKAFEYWIVNLSKIISEQYPSIKEFNLLRYLSQFMIVH